MIHNNHYGPNRSGDFCSHRNYNSPRILYNSEGRFPRYSPNDSRTSSTNKGKSVARGVPRTLEKNLCKKQSSVQHTPALKRSHKTERSTSFRDCDRQFYWIEGMDPD